MELLQSTAPSRTSLHAEERFVLTSGEKIKIMTPGEPSTVRLEEGPGVGEEWELVVTINGEAREV